MACYSAMKFYNHDVSRQNFGWGKQKRVKHFISKALSAIQAEIPSTKACCNDVLPKWATKE